MFAARWFNMIVMVLTHPAAQKHKVTFLKSRMNKKTFFI